MVSMGAPTRKKVVESDILSLDYGVCTHIGQRQHNQDDVLVSSTPLTLSCKGHLFAVADGMGGHPGGSVASSLVYDGLKHYHDKMIKEKVKPSSADLSRHLAEAIIRMDRTIRLQGLIDSKLGDSGRGLKFRAWKNQIIKSPRFFSLSNVYGVVTDPIVSLAWLLCFVSVCENIKYLERRLCQLRFSL